MKFLHGEEYLKTLQNLLRKSQTIDMAIAFWGKSAPERLLLANSKAKIRLVCNLTSRGTNPDAIRKLQENSNIELRMKSDLHAKVFIFDSAIVIGSANASTYGLPSTEDIAARKKGLWEEAGVVFYKSEDNRNFWDTVHTWFNTTIWNKSPKIEEADIDRAALLRNCTPGESITLFQALQQKPHIFETGNWRLAIYSKTKTEIDDEICAFLEEREGNSAFDFFYDLHPDMKSGMKLLSFYRSPKTPNKVRYDGVWDLGKQYDYKDAALFPAYEDTAVFGKNNEKTQYTDNNVYVWTDFIDYIVTTKELGNENLGLLLPIDEVTALLKEWRQSKANPIDPLRKCY